MVSSATSLLLRKLLFTLLQPPASNGRSSSLYAAQLSSPVHFAASHCSLAACAHQSDCQAA